MNKKSFIKEEDKFFFKLLKKKTNNFLKI